MSRLTAVAVIVCAFALAVSAANAEPMLGASEWVSISARRHVQSDSTVIGRRPAGCPHAYCGCGASLYLFGVNKRELWLAWAWVERFPRAAPAPRMAAANHRHVMVLISHVSGSDWLVHDSNSGGGLTREHVRSIKGYVIVDPSGSRMAQR